MFVAPALALALSLCGAKPEWLGPRPAKIERIVSLAPSATELVFALGAGPRVVGVTRFDNWPTEVRALPKVGGFIDPDPEAIVALRPDLVIAVPTSGGRARIDLLARLGLAVLVLPAAGLDDLWTAIAALGETLHRQDSATLLASSLRAKLESVRQRYRDTAPLRLLVIVGRKPLVAAGPGSFLDGLLPCLKSVNVLIGGGAYPMLDLEAVSALRPEVIVDLSGSSEGPDPRFWDSARKLGGLAGARVVSFDSEALVRPGPRTLDALADLARTLRPTLP